MAFSFSLHHIILYTWNGMTLEIYIDTLIMVKKDLFIGYIFTKKKVLVFRHNELLKLSNMLIFIHCFIILIFHHFF